MKNKQVKQMIFDLTYNRLGAKYFCKYRPLTGNTGGVHIDLLREMPKFAFHGKISVTANKL